MNTRTGLAIVLFSATCLFSALRAESPPKSNGPDIYDEGADVTRQISDALAVAKKNHQRVLLQFGANWCSWCHKLHNLFESDPQISATLKQSYVVVMVDVNKEHNEATDKKYGHPTSHGLPAIVILDSDGKQLVTKDTGELEEGDHYNLQKVSAFLKEWSGKKG